MCSVTAGTPNLSGMTAALASTSRKYDYGSGLLFKFNYAGKYIQQTIFQQNFTITTSAAYLKAELGANFLIGDVRVWLTSFDNQGSQTQSGLHFRNMHFMDSVLLPGTYMLSIVTGDTQNNVPAGLPACALYSFHVSIAPIQADWYEECVSYRHMPESLNTPQFLGTSPEVCCCKNGLSVPNVIVGPYSRDFPCASKNRVHISPYIVSCVLTPF